MSGAAVSRLVDAMGRPSVKHINLSSNAIREEGAKAVAGALTSGSGVEVLLLDTCDLGKNVPLHLAPALAGNKNLLNLDLAFNGLEDDAAESLAQALPNTVIVELNLKQNKIGDAGAEALATSMMNLDQRKLKLNLEKMKLETREPKPWEGSLNTPFTEWLSSIWTEIHLAPQGIKHCQRVCGWTHAWKAWNPKDFTSPSVPS